jgi:SNF2 family DNA or RNA helicase
MSLPGLYPFQDEGVNHLVTRRCVLLADEMGLGKTVQAAVAMGKLFQMGAVRRALIVCPASLCRNWRKEIRAWSPELPVVLYEGGDRHGMLSGGAKILVGSFETIVGDMRIASRNGERFFDCGFDLVVIDEAQRIKEAESQKARVLSKLLAGRRWAISGTPMENSPRDLASILRFLWPNELPDDESLGDSVLIFSLRDRCMLRRTKRQVGLQLPEKVYSRVNIGMNPGQSAEYEQAVTEIQVGVESAQNPTGAMGALLAGLQKLRRLAVISSDGDSSKIDLLEDEIDEIVSSGEKVVVFSSFANLVLPVVAQRLRRYGTLLFTGGMSHDERSLAHERFLHDPSAAVMCASLKAAGVGLTWTVASHVYHLDTWWNPQVLRQAEDRVHRIGQERTVIVKQLIAEGTLEEAIDTLLLSKTEIFELVVEGAPLANLPAHSVKELASLVGLKLPVFSGGAH